MEVVIIVEALLAHAFNALLILIIARFFCLKRSIYMYIYTHKDKYK